MALYQPNANGADDALTPAEWLAGICAVIAPLVSVALVALLVVGCVYKGGKVTEGTDLAVGLNVPMSEGCLQLQVLNYLSGFRVGVDRNAIMTIRYTVAETNSYFGCVHTATRKTADVTVEPCETKAGDGDADTTDTAYAGAQ